MDNITFVGMNVRKATVCVAWLSRGRVARPFGSALTDPGGRLSRIWLFPEGTSVMPRVTSSLRVFVVPGGAKLICRCKQQRQSSERHHDHYLPEQMTIALLVDLQEAAQQMHGRDNGDGS